MSTYDRVRDLPLEVESYRLEGLEIQASHDFSRRTTVIHLEGGGHEGVGEDVTYSGEDHAALQEAGPGLPLAGSHTLDGFSRLLASLELFPAGASRPAFLDYRRWAYESAALDLALRQAGVPLAEAVGREAHPVTFVVSLRIEQPPRPDPVPLLLERYPGLRFKLDPTEEWDAELVAALAGTGAVDTVDLKGAYKGTPVDQAGDPDLYRMVAEGFPDAWIEDPDLNEATDRVLEPHRERITWDAPIHSVEDILALPFPPRTINFKPSRFGSVRRLFDGYDHCAEQGMAIYGGGQWELGPGRGQIQHLASLFHPGTPNDVAPAAFNIHRLDPPPGLPTSPLEPQPSATGFRWGAPAS
jgi:L-alanine-DL-glutamate epimerase-like enolase superfamily enzyme